MDIATGVCPVEDAHGIWPLVINVLGDPFGTIVDRQDNVRRLHAAAMGLKCCQAGKGDVVCHTRKVAQVADLENAFRPYHPGHCERPCLSPLSTGKGHHRPIHAHLEHTVGRLSVGRFFFQEVYRLRFESDKGRPCGERLAPYRRFRNARAQEFVQVLSRHSERHMRTQPRYSLGQLR